MRNHGEFGCHVDAISGHRLHLHDLVPTQNPSIYPLPGESKTLAPSVVSTRWNPTPGQLEALEGIYRRGMRTPTADQIQQITARLKRLGSIERKNVFYWFQNRKAREKKKNRRLFELFPDEKWIHSSRKKQPGLMDIGEDGKDKLSGFTGSCSTYSTTTASEDCVVKGNVDHEGELCEESVSIGFSEENQLLWRGIVAPHQFIEFLPTKK